MNKSFYLFALFCLLSLSVAQKGFLSTEFANGENCEENNWENEECNWEEENVWNDLGTDSNGQAGKAPADAGNPQGNSAEDIGAAVKAGIVKLGNAVATNAGNSSDIPSTGNQTLDQLISGISAAISSLDNDVEAGAGQVGSDLGDIVTNSINAAQKTPNDVSGAVGGAISQGISGLNNKADDIGKEVGQSVENAVQQIIKNDPDAQNNQALANITKASDQIAAAVSSLVSSTAGQANAIGGAIGDAVGDAVNEGKNASATAGDAVANLDNIVVGNASAIGNAIADELAQASATDPTITQDQINAEKAEVTQAVTAYLQNTTQADIDNDRNSVTQAVDAAINTVQSQGDNASQDAAAVIGALADQGVAQIQGN